MNTSCESPQFLFKRAPWRSLAACAIVLLLGGCSRGFSAQSGRADALVNVTNDAWFGHSSARHQHLQIARMRALEEGRYLVRAANDGISAVIGPHGEVIARAPEFKPDTLVSDIVPYAGLSPYAHVGNWLVVSLATVALAYGLWVRNDRRPRRRQYR